MAKAIIPLAPLPATARGWSKSIGTSAKDQQLINGVYETNGKDVYVSKRSGSATSSTIGLSNIFVLTHYSSIFTTGFISVSTIFASTLPTNYGTLDAVVSGKNNFILADSVSGSIGILAWVTTSGTGWFLYSDAITTNFPTFTGDTHTNTVIDGITSTTGLYPGQAISGTGIAAGTRIATITSATAITVTIATTGTATVTITKEAIAKVIDADFPSSVTSVVALNGRFFWSSGGNIYQSALNDPSAYTAGEYIPADFAGDSIAFLFKVGQYIAAAGSRNTIQYFRYGQNSFGSVLSKVDELTVLGLQLTSGPIDYAGIKYILATPQDSGSDKSQKGLFRLSGLNSFERVSDDIMSSIIIDQQYTRIGVGRMGDKTLLILHSSVATVLTLYDPSVNEFSFLTLSAALISSGGEFFTKASATSLFGWATNNTWTDSTVAFTLTAQTEPLLLNNGMGFTINYVDLIADIEASGTATLSTSTDDGATWTDIGTFDMTQNKKRINAGGFAPATTSLRVTHSANTGFRATKLIVDYTTSLT